MDTPAPAPAMPAVVEDVGDPSRESLRRIVERPDGFHWLAPDGHQEFGPWATLDEALAAMDSDDGARSAGELADAEGALGMTGWIDPETGEPAEDTATRIEEH